MLVHWLGVVFDTRGRVCLFPEFAPTAETEDPADNQANGQSTGQDNYAP